MQSVDSMIPVLSIFLFCYYIHISNLFKFTRNFTDSYKMLMTLKKSQNFTYYAGMLLPSYYAQNYAGIICSSLILVTVYGKTFKGENFRGWNRKGSFTGKHSH